MSKKTMTQYVKGIAKRNGVNLQPININDKNGNFIKRSHQAIEIANDMSREHIITPESCLQEIQRSI